MINNIAGEKASCYLGLNKVNIQAHADDIKLSHYKYNWTKLYCYSMVISSI